MAADRTLERSMHIPSVVALTLSLGLGIGVLVRARRSPLRILEGVLLVVAGGLTSVSGSKLIIDATKEPTPFQYWAVAVIIGLGCIYAINEVRDVCTRKLDSDPQPMWRKVVSYFCLVGAVLIGAILT